MNDRRQVHSSADSQAGTRKAARVPPVNPMALDPYSPTATTRLHGWNESAPLALEPYGPLFRQPLL